MLGVFGLSLVFSIALCVHVVRTNQAMFWLWIILMIPWLGGLVYLAAVVVPSLTGSPSARRLGQSARGSPAWLGKGRSTRRKVRCAP